MLVKIFFTLSYSSIISTKNLLPSVIKLSRYQNFHFWFQWFVYWSWSISDLSLPHLVFFLFTFDFHRLRLSDSTLHVTSCLLPFPVSHYYHIYIYATTSTTLVQYSLFPTLSENPSFYNTLIDFSFYIYLLFNYYPPL